MREKRDDPQWRLASIREAREAANGDWHKLTNLWSIQDDLDWLLAVAELHFAAPDPGAGLESDRLRRIETAARNLNNFATWSALNRPETQALLDALAEPPAPSAEPPETT